MYNHIQGRVTEKTPTYVVIDCGGVGYLVNISLYTYSHLPDTEHCRLFTHLAVKEDAHTLFGFIDEEERRLFRLLISVSGVGAATARMILSSLSPAEIQQAITTADVLRLQSVKGIGAKTAQRIIIDLGDKLKRGEMASAVVLSGAGNRIKEQALSALVTLGFSRNVAEKAVDGVLRNNAEEPTVEQIIKLALNNL